MPRLLASGSRHDLTCWSNAVSSCRRNPTCAHLIPFPATASHGARPAPIAFQNQLPKNRIRPNSIRGASVDNLGRADTAPTGYEWTFDVGSQLTANHKKRTHSLPQTMQFAMAVRQLPFLCAARQFLGTGLLPEWSGKSRAHDTQPLLHESHRG